MTDRFAFEARWGSFLAPDGSATFRLWAPSLDTLRLRLGQDDERRMPRDGDGWFVLEVDDARPNTAYSFVLPDGRAVPDPAARAQGGGVHGPSLLIDPRAYKWRTSDWRGRPWEDAVTYELHVGAFSPEGGFAGVEKRLDYLAGLGVTAIEIMPVAQFPGRRGWGYDGVLPYCPHEAYGGVDGLKSLVDAAHERGLMVLLDVVYNHFGPDGNHIASYAPEFFDPARHTPWGAAIRFDNPAVRAFFVDNPLYWLEEYRLDGLRFDAIDQIADASRVHILQEMAERVRERFGDRHVHLTTEDERNIVWLHPRNAAGRPRLFTAEWNDDFHHAVHCIATGEDAGYYAGFADDPAGRLARVLAQGFAYQGEPYKPWQGKPRGVPSMRQPPVAFVSFLQNHDQIGNRAFGERLTTLADPRTVELLTAILFLNPQMPLVFMGEEFAETRPFLFFTDFHGELANAVRDGRRREFRTFGGFSGERAHEIPDPNAAATFDRCRLDWTKTEGESGKARLALFRRLARLRRRHVAPRLKGMLAMNGRFVRAAPGSFVAGWTMGDGALLSIGANFSDKSAPHDLPTAGSEMIFESGGGVFARFLNNELDAQSVVAAIRETGERAR